MATNIQNASNIMDALTDWRGKSSLSSARKIEIAGKVTGNIGTNSEKASALLQFLFKAVTQPLRQGAENIQRQNNADGVTQAGDDEVADL